MKETPIAFNIRVYGLLVRPGSVLVCEEQHLGRDLVKFPGGGLEFGEGIIDCLKREWKEELGIQITPVRHVYTTEDFVRSAFDQSEQLISIYYEVMTSGEIPETYAGIRYRWMELKNESALALSFPIDKHVFSLLVKESI